MIYILWVWIISAVVVFVAALLASLRLRYWWNVAYMRLLVLLFVGAGIGAVIDLYLSAQALSTPGVTLDLPLSDPRLRGVELLTVSRLCLLIPALLLAVQLLGIFERPNVAMKGPPL
jgi:hypothetical protein